MISFENLPDGVSEHIQNDDDQSIYTAQDKPTQEIAEIKWLRQNTDQSGADISERYSVSESQVYYIGSGECWETITPKKPDWF